MKLFTTYRSSDIQRPDNAVLLVNASTRKLKGSRVFSCPTANDLEDKLINDHV